MNSCVQGYYSGHGHYHSLLDICFTLENVDKWHWEQKTVRLSSRHNSSTWRIGQRNDMHCTRSYPSINRCQEISRIIAVPNIDNIFLQSSLSWQWIRVRFYWSNYNIQNVRQIPDVPLVNHYLHSQTSRYCYTFFGVVVLSNKVIDLFTNIQ